MSKKADVVERGMQKGAGMKKDSPVQLKPTVVPTPTTPKK